MGSGGGNNGTDAALFQPIAKAIGIIRLVGDEAAGRHCSAQRRNVHRDVSDVAGRQRESDQLAVIVGQAMSLARPAAAGEADRVFPFPLLEPVADWCALTWLLPIDNS